jgi:hypothetical protein
MPSVKSNNSCIKLASSAQFKTQFSYKWQVKQLQPGPWTDVVYGPVNTLVVTAPNRYTYSTTNGDTWNPYTFPFNPTGITETYNAVGWGNGTWVMMESLEYAPFGTQQFYTSVNILTGWTPRTLSPELTAPSYGDCIYSSYHNRFIVIGDKEGRISSNMVGCYSTDGVNWLSANFLSYAGNPQQTLFGFNGNITEGYQMPNNRLVACGDAGDTKFGYSNNGGATWRLGGYQTSTSPLNQNLQSGHSWAQVAYGYDGNNILPLSGRYVACCGTGTTSTYQFAYSDDGIGWYGVSYASPDLKRNWGCVTYGNGYFVALGIGYQAMSKDGKNWVSYANMPAAYPVGDVTVANNRFVAVQTGGVGVGSTSDAFIAGFFR